MLQTVVMKTPGRNRVAMKVGTIYVSGPNLQRHAAELIPKIILDFCCDKIKSYSFLFIFKKINNEFHYIYS